MRTPSLIGHLCTASRLRRGMVRSFGFKQANTYVCIRISGGTPGDQTVEEFDIGYVIRCINEQKPREFF